MAGRKIVVDIVGDASKFAAATKQAQKSAGVFGNITKGIGQGIGIGFTNIVSDAAAAVVGFGIDSVKAASNLAETMTKSAVIFKDNANAIARWGDQAADSMGLSKRAAIDAASGFAGLFKTVGIGIDDASGMAQKLTGLGSDLASFFNTDMATALAALKSGLSGESEPLRAFNVFLSETAVKAKLVEMGVKAVGGKFTEAQKATARYKLILEQTADAQGDFARTSDGLANSTRTLDAKLEDLQAQLGQSLTPAVTDATGASIELVEALGRVGSMLDDTSAATNRLRDNAQQAGIWWQLTGQQIDGASQTFEASVVSASLVAFRAGERIQNSSQTTLEEVLKDNRKMVRSYGTIASYLLGKYNEDFDTALGIVEARADLSAGRHEAAALRKQIASGKLTTKEKKDAEARIRELDVESAAHYEALAGMGALSSAQYDAWLGVVEKLAKGTKGKVHDAYMAAIADIKALRASAREPINVTVNYRKKGQKAGGWGGQAAGGPYAAGEPFWVGEQGPELRVESAPGYTLSHADSMAAVRGRGGSGGGGPVTIVLQVDGREMARVVDRHLYYEAARAPRSAF